MHFEYRNASDQYWLMSFRSTLPSPNLERIQYLLPCEDVIERWRLTFLHKIILRLNSFELHDILKFMSRRELDSRDHRGRTALWWATYRDDAAALSLLIRHGANINIPSSTGYVPLSIALKESPTCARILLDAGAVTTSVAGERWPLLVAAAHLGTPIDIIEQLILRGSDIDIIASNGSTALMSAAQEGHTNVCEYLISQKADINHVNDEEECALHFAIYYRRPEPARLLLASGAQTYLKTRAGESILHYGALYGDVATLEALGTILLKGIRLEDKITSSSPVQQSKDVVGCTAAQIAEQRSDVSAEWHEAFRRLVQGIETVNESGIGSETVETRNDRSYLVARTTTHGDDVNDVDYFEDAVEHQMEEVPLPTNPGRARSRTF